VPALATVLLLGDQATGSLLVLSQVVLSLQLPFAVIPLVSFVSNKRLMGELQVSKALTWLAWTVALIIVRATAPLTP
jgi:manganese transport protein